MNKNSNSLWIISACVLFAQTVSGNQVLWDIHHGVHPVYNISEENSRLFQIVEEYGFSIILSEAGVLNEDLSQYDGIILSIAGAYDSPFSEEEADVIEGYVHQGGWLLIMHDICYDQAYWHINPVSERFGVTAEYDYIIPHFLNPIIQHPIFEGVGRLALNCASPLTVEPPSISGASNIVNQVGISIAEIGLGRVVITGDVSLFLDCCFLGGGIIPPSCCESGDNEIFTQNLFRWLLRLEPCEPLEPPQVRSQGYWRRQCMDSPHEDICALVEGVHELSDHFDSFNCDAVCDLMLVEPPENDMCRKAERQFMALLLNVSSGKLSLCNCLLDGRTIEDVISEIESLLSASQTLNSGSENHATCVHAMSLAEGINSGESLVNCNFYALNDVKDEEPIGFLSSNPNPFRTGTVIQYEVRRESSERVSVQLKIYDVMGRVVKVLVDGEVPAGSHIVNWDGTNQAGERVQSGVYFYRLKKGGAVTTNKAVLFR